MTKIDEIMVQVGYVARSYVQVQYDFKNDHKAIAHIAEVDKLRAMIDDVVKTPVGVVTTSSLLVVVPLDCRKCVNFIWRTISCRCTCVNGHLYRSSGFVQIFRKE
jgi:hypothetical protein